MTSILLPERKILLPRFEFPAWLKHPRERVAQMLAPLGGTLTPLGVSGANPFSPLDIAGLKAWYDFSDVATLFTDSARTAPITADGNVIGGVTDKSGSGNHLAQMTTGNKPLYKTNIQNGLSAALFDGADDFLSLAGTIGIGNNVTFFLVVRQNSAATQRNTIFGQNNTANAMQVELGSLGSSQYSFGTIVPGSFVANASSGSASNKARLWVYVRNGAGANHSIYCDQNAKTLVDNTADSYTANSSQELGRRASGSQLFSGYLFDVLIYTETLSATDINRVSDYLARWAY